MIEAEKMCYNIITRNLFIRPIVNDIRFKKNEVVNIHEFH